MTDRGGGGPAPGAGAPRPRRRLGREAALQMLYQSEVGGTDIAEAVETYWQIEQPDSEPPEGSVRRFAAELATGTARHLAEIDPLISAAAANWRLPRMAVIDRAILRIAVYEFLHAPETPPNAVINEAVELARRFGGDDSVKFVNGILDGVKRRLEGEEGHAPRT